MGHPPQYPPYPPYPPYPYGPPGPPQPSGTGDRVVSIIVLVLAALMVAAGAFLGLMLLAFLDYCPQESCSADGAVVSVVTAVGLATAVGIGGLVFTSVRMSRRKIAWPFAVGTLVLCAVVFGGGLIAYQASVGWT